MIYVVNLIIIIFYNTIKSQIIIHDMDKKVAF